MLAQPGIEPQNLLKNKKITPTLYQLSYHVYLPLMAKKLKLDQLELLENYFKMPSSNEIDNCGLRLRKIEQCWICIVWHFLSQLKTNCNFRTFRSGVRFLFLFVLTDAILLKLDLQKRTSVLGNPPNEKLFVYKKWSTYQKIGDVLFFSYIKATIGQCELVMA